MNNYELLVRKLLTLENENQCVEFKHDNYDPEMIGKDICALSNSAKLYGFNNAYMIWGIEDYTHNIVGTTRNLFSIKIGNQELENWLRGHLSTNINFSFHSTTIDGYNIGILVIEPILTVVGTFKKTAYIRVGSYTKKLSDHPNLESNLWSILKQQSFESQIALAEQSIDDVFNLLDHGEYLKRQHISLSQLRRENIIHYFIEDGIIVEQDNSLYGITNLGAILFARDLKNFSNLRRKSLRFVKYEGISNTHAVKEFIEETGYAVCFDTFINYILAFIPSKEIYDNIIREEIYSIPKLVIRELIANALIHQDFAITGTGTIIEFYSNRIEITNPGAPLIDTYRIIDNPPKARNSKLASLMRRMDYCEERGCGWDRVLETCEENHLPAPKFTIYDEFTKVTIYLYSDFKALNFDERIWTCYLHACLCHIHGSSMTNQSLRKRFGLNTNQNVVISKLIKATLEKNLIIPEDPNTAPRYMKYKPFWA